MSWSYQTTNINKCHELSCKELLFFFQTAFWVLFTVVSSEKAEAYAILTPPPERSRGGGGVLSIWATCWVENVNWGAVTEERGATEGGEESVK